jgi:NAD(P)H-flavin reductase
MASKNLIIGGFTNYGINELKPWVLSAKEVGGDNTDVVLVYGNTSEETLDWLQ